MRIRTIKPEFFKHDGIAKLPPLTRILFVGLWCLADCKGRLEDRPSRIKVEVLPYDDIDVDAALNVLAEAKFIVRYHADGFSLLQVASFSKHQRITGRESESESRFPAPEEVKTKKQRSKTGKHPGNTEETPGTTGNGRETEGKGKESASAPEVPLLLNVPVFIEAWTRWIDVRKKSKSRPKTPWPEFFGSQLKWLEPMGPEAAAEVVNQSIRNGWQGLFPLRANQQGHAAPAIDPKFQKF